MRYLLANEKKSHFNGNSKKKRRKEEVKLRKTTYFQCNFKYHWVMCPWRIYLFIYLLLLHSYSVIDKFLGKFLLRCIIFIFCPMWCLLAFSLTLFFIPKQSSRLLFCCLSSLPLFLRFRNRDVVNFLYSNFSASISSVMHRCNASNSNISSEYNVNLVFGMRASEREDDEGMSSHSGSIFL